MERVIRVTIDPATGPGAKKVEGDLKRIEYNADKVTVGFRTIRDVAREAFNTVSASAKPLTGSLRSVAMEVTALQRQMKAFASVKNFAKVGVTVDVASLQAAQQVLKSFQVELRKVQSAALAAQNSIRGISNALTGLNSFKALDRTAKDAAAVSKGLNDAIKQANGLKTALAQVKAPNINMGGGAAGGGIGAGFKGLVGGAAFTTLARDVTNYAKAIAGLMDEYSKIQNQLRLVTSGSENLARVQGELFNLAQETRSPLEATSVLYAKIARNAAELGLSQQQVLGITKTVNQAIQVSGGTAAEASAGVIQFSQALASGVLRGDELRSMMENMPRLSQALSDGLGVNIGDLRKMGEAGELTAEKVIGALQKSAASVNAEFAKLTPTIGGAFTTLRNSIVDTVGKLNEATGVGTAFANAVIGLAEMVTQFGRALTGTLAPTDEVTSGLKLFTSAILIAYGAIEPFVTAITGVFSTAFTSIGQLIGGFAATLAALFEGDFKRAGQIAGETINDFNNNISTGLMKTTEQIIADMSKRIESLVELWDEGARQAAPAQAALLGGKKLKETSGKDDFNKAADEIRKDPLYNPNPSPNGLPMPDDFAVAGMTSDIQEDALKDIEEANRATWDSIRYNMGQIKDETSEYAKEAARNIQDSFAEFLFDPFNKGLEGMLEGFITTMRKIAAEALAAKAMEMLSGFLSKSGNPYLSAIGGIMGGRAEGGNVQKGVPYMVNERAYQKKRPEVFVPNRAGKVMDQGRLPAGGGAEKPTFVFAQNENDIANAITSHRGTQEALLTWVSTHPGKFKRAMGMK